MMEKILTRNEGKKTGKKIKSFFSSKIDRNRMKSEFSILIHGIIHGHHQQPMKQRPRHQINDDGIQENHNCYLLL